eukprot:c4139_g1_i1.p1 GENE.c4139_g1_i1~~c4139_g1_i1.p1  ORF type:complete len:227 (+),score=16.48 c4139_g1_i1:38-718(+)
MGRLHLAVQRGNLEEISALLGFADVNDHSSELYPPLHLACRLGNLAVAELLLENGADVNLKYEFDNWDGETCMHIAVRRNDLNLATLLMNFGADVNVTDRVSGKSVMDTIQSEEIKHMVKTKMRERWLSFMMGFHPRLGSNSLVHTIPSDLIPLILREFKPVTLCSTPPIARSQVSEQSTDFETTLVRPPLVAWVLPNQVNDRPKSYRQWRSLHDPYPTRKSNRCK